MLPQRTIGDTTCGYTFVPSNAFRIQYIDPLEANEGIWEASGDAASGYDLFILSYDFRSQHMAV